MFTRTTLALSACVLAVPMALLLPLTALAQPAPSAAPVSPAPAPSAPPTPPTPPTPPADPAKPAALNLAAFPPPQRLGIRANFLQRQLGIIPTLVLVPDEGSYIAAIRGWSTGPKGATRYPVLIDDGSWASQQRIMRFARAFKPKSIVRWQAPEAERRLPDDLDARRSLIESAVASAWSVHAPAPTTPAALRAEWKKFDFEPAGAVIAWPDDPAWPAALALAASRGQPIIWVKPTNPDVNGSLDLPALDAISGAVIAGLEETGYAFRTLGDTIDALTLCLNVPSKVWLGDASEAKYYATTDVLGRTVKEPRRDRWAYASQIFGDRPSSAYDAMCGLFLVPDNAWLFDGYDSTQPWVLWDMTRAAEPLRQKAGMTVLLDDPEGGAGASIRELRDRAAGSNPNQPARLPGIDAGLISFNTKGNPDFFTLNPGNAKPADIPLLRRPAMVYFVHSFSFNQPANLSTVAGVWLSRGVYAYIGSVHEPTLGGFTPTPYLTGRMAEGAAWAAAARENDSKVWKIAVFGDALIAFGPQGPRLSAPLPLAQPTILADTLAPLLIERKFADALRLLALQGRDADAARLCLAIAKDSPADLTPEAALAAVSSCFFSGDAAAFQTAATACLPALQDQQRVERERLQPVRDMIWHALWPDLGKLTPQQATLLAGALRPENLARDAQEGYAAIMRTQGEDAARAFLDKARLMVKDRETSDAIDKIGR